MIFKGCESDYADYIGDGYCDDANNHQDCQYDDGDCCGDDVFTNYCSECICYDESGSSSSGTTQTPIHTSESGVTNGGGTFYIFIVTFLTWFSCNI